MEQLWTAMITPFTTAGDLDRAAVPRLVEHLLHTGTEGLVVTGTTGEAPTLSLEERKIFWDAVLEAVAGRVRVFAGTGSNSTATTLTLTQAAAEAGMDGVMVVAPYYNKPSPAGLYAHFQLVAASTPLPLMVYNIPGRTAVRMDVPLLLKIAALPTVVAIKESSGDLAQVSELVRQLPSDVVLYSGDDPLTLPVLSLGGVGVVSVASHLCGEALREMIRAFRQGEVGKAAAYHHHCWPMFTQLFATTNPVPVKHGLAQLGLCTAHVRLPLVPLPAEAQAEFSETFQTFLSSTPQGR